MDTQIADKNYVGFKLVVDHPTPAHFTSLGQYLSENVRVTSFLLRENVWVTSMLPGEGTSLPRGGGMVNHQFEPHITSKTRNVCVMGQQAFFCLCTHERAAHVVLTDF